jgi:hypothetical protein
MDVADLRRRGLEPAGKRSAPAAVSAGLHRPGRIML